MNFGWIAENWCRDFQGTPEWIENQHPTHEGLISWYHVKISSIIATTKGWQFFDKKLVEVGWFGSFGGLKCLSGTFFEKKKHLQKISQLLLLADLPPLVSQDHPRYRNRSDRIHPPIEKLPWSEWVRPFGSPYCPTIPGLGDENNHHGYLGGGFEYFLFSPRSLGKWSNLTNIF